MKPRTLQVWTDAGVLLAESDTDRQGRGTHRRYRRSEVIIALIMSEMYQYNFPVGTMKEISGLVRDIIVEDVMFSRSPTKRLNGIKYFDQGNIGVVFSYLISKAIYHSGKVYFCVSTSKTNDYPYWTGIYVHDRDAVNECEKELGIINDSGKYMGIRSISDMLSADAWSSSIIVNIRNTFSGHQHHF